LYVILIAFPLQQCLHECASALRYTYVAWFFLSLIALIKATQCLLHFIHKCPAVSSASAHFTGKLDVTHSVTPRVLHYRCQPNCDSLVHPSSHSLTHTNNALLHGLFH
jgi:hypothetical protein